MVFCAKYKAKLVIICAFVCESRSFKKYKRLYSKLLTLLDPEKIAQHIDQKEACSFVLITEAQ